ncbi:MAG: hypothetical protein WBD74_08680 [Candidatus Aquilonibacter sp.]
MKNAAVILLVVLWTSAAPLVVQADPLRTVVYHFSIDASGFGNLPASSGVELLYDNGVGAASGARTGKIEVTVVQATPDGGLVVDGGETIDRADKPLQTIRCALYGATTDVVCDLNVGATLEELMLLTYLGRQFLDTSRLDDKGHWHTTPHVKSGTMDIQSDFTVSKVDGQKITITVDREERNGGYRSTTTGNLLYDAAMDVPDSIRLETAATQTRGEADVNLDCRLLSDSMAKTGSQNPH